MQASFARRAPGQQWAHASFATLMLMQTGTAAQVGEIRYAPQLNPLDINDRSLGASCRPGEVYLASGYVSSHRARTRVRLIFWNAAGQIIETPPSAWSGPTPGSSTRPDTWTRQFRAAVAPTDAVWVTASFQKEGTAAGSADSYMFVWKPQLEETHSVNALPALYTSGEAGYWTGESFFSRSIAARAIDVEDLAVTGLATLNRAYVRHLNINGFAIAKLTKSSKTKWQTGASTTTDVLKMTGDYGAADFTSGWVPLIVMGVTRLAGYETELDVMLDHAAAGSWNSSKPNMSVLQTRWQRKRSNQADASYVNLNMMHSQSGEYGVRVTNALQYTDPAPITGDAGFYTIYRLVGRKMNLARHQGMHPYIYNVRCTLTHYKRG